MLRYTTLGAQLTLFLFTALATIAAYMPFLTFFAYTPAFAFIHRLSITLNIGDSTKTIQAIVFIAPILIIKALWAYHKRYGISQLFKTKIIVLLSLLVFADLLSVATSIHTMATVNVLLTHLMNWGLFLASSIWLALLSDLLDRETVRKYGLKLLKVFSIAIIIFTLVNALISVWQFVDCTLPHLGCRTWNAIDEAFPNKLLPVGHQRFSHKPIVIRAYGVFGDVNFNGMYSLLVVVIAGTLAFLGYLLQNRKGYQLTKELRWLLITICAALVSFLLTLSRSAILGAGAVFVVLLAVLLLPAVKQYKLPANFTSLVKKGVSVGLLALVVLLGSGFLIPMHYVTSTGDEKSTTLTTQLLQYVNKMFHPEQSSAQAHVDLFSSAIRIGNQSPLFGQGMGTFGSEYQRLFAPEGGQDTDPHSTYGRLYAEQGIIGLSVYLVVIVSLWIHAIKQLQHFRNTLITNISPEQRLKKEEYYLLGARLLFTLLAFGVPFFSVATISYYGFFLPMTWWWGNGELVKTLKS